MGNTDSRGGTNTNSALSPANTFSLDISYRKLDHLPTDITKLINLSSLSFSNNEITDISCIVDNKKLEEIDGSGNKIDKIPDNIFVALRGIKKFNLSKNILGAFYFILADLLHRDLPITVCHLILLVELNVSNNKLSRLCAEVGVLQNLTFLNISFNEIKALPPEIGKLTSLTKLLVNNNLITELCPQIGSLTSLTLLNLAENEFKHLPHDIGNLALLSKLYLDNNDLHDVHPNLAKLTALRELNLRSNQLIDLPSSMANLTNLTILDIDENPWDNKRYNGNDIPELLAFLKGKNDQVRRRTNTLTKDFRRTQTRKQLEEMAKQLKETEHKDSFVVVETMKRLFHLKGQQRFIIRRVDPVPSSLNNGDVFILDTGKKNLFVWCGPKSNLRERKKGAHVAYQLNDEMGGGSDVILLDGKARKEDILRPSGLHIILI